MSALLELAERCEQGHVDYQRTLLSDAAYAVFGDEADHRDDPTFWPKAVDFTTKLRAQAYLDAALTLVPESWTEGYTRSFDGSVAAVCSCADGSAFYGHAATPALALCAAALKARGASADTHAEHRDVEQARPERVGSAVGVAETPKEGSRMCLPGEE